MNKNILFAKYFIFICVILNFFPVEAQEEELYTYYIYVNDSKKGTKFTTKKGKAEYTGENLDLKKFFNAHHVKEFFQAFPEIPDDELQKVYVLKTDNQKLIEKMLAKFPQYYKKADDISKPAIPLSYPNDYGTTSPVVNLGVPFDRKELDYISAPLAWDITTGLPNIIIGISDTAVDNTLPDLVNKTSYVSGYHPSQGDYHGSNVAALAAAQGDNGQGTVGVCYNCDILSASIGFGETSNVTTSNLYKLASEGAKVINMSWHNGTGYGAEGHGYIQAEQDVINFCVNNYGTIFVAAAGNESSFSSSELFHKNSSGDPITPFGTLYVYPASYDNVISVSLISAKYPELNSDSFCCSSPLFGAIYLFLEDSVSPNIDGIDLNNPMGIAYDNGYDLVYTKTVNHKVDILAPSYNQFEYYEQFYNEPDASGDFYAGATSYAAPFVSGTIGLMLSVNECLSGSEVEDILQLVSKDIEHMPMNAPFFGMVGSGKLETGNSVHFVNEMKKTDGVAVIKDHIFYRFDFNLNQFMNDLLIDNVSFIDSVTVDFKAKHSIDLAEGTLLEPNNDGYIILDIDEALQNNCSSISSKRSKIRLDNEEVIIEEEIKVYPTLFSQDVIVNNQGQESIQTIKIYNILGVEVYTTNKINRNRIILDLGQLATGMYILQAINNFNEVIHTQKIIRK